MVMLGLIFFILIVFLVMIALSMISIFLDPHDEWKENLKEIIDNF